jgi:hypothetical protein
MRMRAFARRVLDGGEYGARLEQDGVRRIRRGLIMGYRFTTPRPWRFMA